MRASQLSLWEGNGPWFHVADRFAALEVPAAPKSETRIRLGMLPGAGDRFEGCARYESCLSAICAKLDDDDEAHCPEDCPEYQRRSRADRVAMVLHGTGSSSLAQAQDFGEKGRFYGERRSVAEAVEEALTEGPLSTVELAARTGFRRDVLSGRCADFVREGWLRRAGRSEGANHRRGCVVWALVREEREAS
jgi:hypothetical protein